MNRLEGKLKANGKPFVYGANGAKPMARRRKQIRNGIIKADRWDEETGAWIERTGTG